MPILTSQFASLTDDLQDIFNEAASSNAAELVGNKIFKVTETNRLTYDHLILHGLSGVQKVAEGADLPAATIVEGRLSNFFQGLFKLNNSYCPL
jgi:hypothetical protein